MSTEAADAGADDDAHAGHATRTVVAVAFRGSRRLWPRLLGRHDLLLLGLRLNLAWRLGLTRFDRRLNLYRRVRIDAGLRRYVGKCRLDDLRAGQKRIGIDRR